MNDLTEYYTVVWPGSLPTKPSTYLVQNRKCNKKEKLQTKISITKATIYNIEVIRSNKLFLENPELYMTNWSMDLNQAKRFSISEHNAFSFFEELFLTNKRNMRSLSNKIELKIESLNIKVKSYESKLAQYD